MSVKKIRTEYDNLFQEGSIKTPLQMILASLFLTILNTLQEQHHCGLFYCLYILSLCCLLFQRKLHQIK